MHYEIDRRKLVDYIMRRLKEMGSRISRYELELILLLESEHLEELGLELESDVK